MSSGQRAGQPHPGPNPVSSWRLFTVMGSGGSSPFDLRQKRCFLLLTKPLNTSVLIMNVNDADEQMVATYFLPCVCVCVCFHIYFPPLIFDLIITSDSQHKTVSLLFYEHHICCVDPGATWAPAAKWCCYLTAATWLHWQIIKIYFYQTSTRIDRWRW